MKCSLFSSFLSLLPFLSSVSSLEAPNGYEYKYVNFGEAAPQVLQPGERLASGDQFGRVVALYDSIAAISSFEVGLDYSTNVMGTRGKVFVFEMNYQLQWKDSGLSFISGSYDDGFGTSVALYTGLMAIGAPFDSSSGKNRGKVYVYNGSPFALRAELMPEEDGDDDDFFGHSVAIVRGNTHYGSGGMIVVGAYGHNKHRDKEQTGCVFVYAKDSSGYTWSEVGIVEPSVSVNHGGFGYSLSAYANTLAVGSYGSDYVFLFELEGHLHQCPHHMDEFEEVPAECMHNRRQLRDDRREGDWGYYTEWMYEESLLVGYDKGEEHKPEDKNNINHFGSSVAVYNSSGILTVAVGCSACVNEGKPVGAVYLFTQVKKGDILENWQPERGEEHKRALQGGEGDHGEQKDDKDKEGEDREREERERDEDRERDERDEERERDEDREREEREEKEEREQEERQEQESRKRLWVPSYETHETDTDQIWYREVVFYGNRENERFGWSVAVDDSTLLVGNNPVSNRQGEVVVYTRRKLSGRGAPFVVSGPLFGVVWRWASSLEDSSGVVGDKFGYSVAVHGSVAVVGSILSGLQDDGTFGAGAAYAYDRRYLRKISSNRGGGGSSDGVESDSYAPGLIDEMADSGSAVGATFLFSSSVIGFVAAVSAFYGIYRVTGGEMSPRELLMGKSPSRSSRPVRLVSALDDSSSSTASISAGVVPGRGNTSAYSGLNTSSTHSSSSNQFKPRQQYVPRGPPRPTYTKPASNRGASVARSSFKAGVDDI